MRDRLRWTGALLVLVLALAACGSDDGGGSGTTDFAAGSYMAEIVKAGKLRVGVKFDVPQMGLLSPASGKPEGFDVDMGKEIAKALGVETEFVEAVSANRIPFLNEDKVDIIFSTMTITDARKLEIDFSEVYYVAGQTFLAPKDKPVALDTAAGKKICTAKGSTSEKNVRALAAGAQIILQDGYAQCFQLVQNGQADAMTTDDVILLGYVAKDPARFALSGGRFSLEPYGAGIKKGRSGFQDFVNSVVRAMKADGRWTALYNKWIKPITGESANPPPAEVKAQVRE